MNNSKLVYSTDVGRINEQKSKAEPVPQGDGIVRIKRITKGKKGKGVSAIEGLAMNENDLKKLCSDLKKHCGCGGSVKGFTIEIQGDVRDKLKIYLEKMGKQVKLAGG